MLAKISEHLVLFMKVLIIGASGPIGKTLCEYYQKEILYLAGRSSKDYYLDLNDFKSINTFIKKVEKLNFDLIFVNSGVALKPKLNSYGIETNLMINALGPFYLISQLAKNLEGTKIVITTSIVINYAKPYLEYKTIKEAYHSTKLIEYLLFCYLALKDQNNSYQFAHPGVLTSNVSKELHNGFMRFLIKHWGNKPEKATMCLVKAAENNLSVDAFVCPKFHLFGKPKVKKRKKNLVICQNVLKYCIEKINCLEENYGI